MLFLSPIIYTKKFVETITFYEEKLGFNCISKNDQWKWAKLKFGNVEMMVSELNDHIKFTKPIFTGSFYIYVDDVNSIWQKLKDTCDIAYPLEVFDYGMKEFAIYDNNKYMIQFGEEND